MLSLRRVLLLKRGQQAMLDHLVQMQKPEYKQCTRDLGYLWFMTVDMFEAFYSNYRRSGTKLGWHKVEEAFSQPEAISTISELIASNSLVNKRKPIIERGLRAHLEGDYVASVSILLPQVEGIIWDIGVTRGLVSPEPNSVKKAKGGGEWGFHQLVDEIWKDAPFDSKYTRLFPAKVKDEYYSKTLRHSVLHGRDISQFNKRRSTEVVMLIWGVSETAG